MGAQRRILLGEREPSISAHRRTSQCAPDAGWWDEGPTEDPGCGPGRISPLSLATQGSIVVGIDYDCREKTIYWTDVAGRTISRASLEPGAEPETIINSGVCPLPAPGHLCWVRPRLSPLGLWLRGRQRTRIRVSPSLSTSPLPQGSSAPRGWQWTTSAEPCSGLTAAWIRSSERSWTARSDGCSSTPTSSTLGPSPWTPSEGETPRLEVLQDSFRMAFAQFATGVVCGGVLGVGLVMSGAAYRSLQPQDPILALAAALLHCTPCRKDWLRSPSPSFHLITQGLAKPAVSVSGLVLKALKRSV